MFTRRRFEPQFWIMVIAGVAYALYGLGKLLCSGVEWTIKWVIG